MLVHSNKPQVLRLQNLQETQRSKFSSEFIRAISELLPSNLNRKLQSSLFLMKVVTALPDIYYTISTIYFCRRRLGEEYTYIAMYKQKQYQTQGVLINKKTRLLLSLMEITSRNLFVPLFARFMNGNGNVFEPPNGPNKKQRHRHFFQKVLEMIQKLRERLCSLFGSAQDIMSNVEWLILMVYMLDWNKHFTFIETLLGIRYAYTYKNDQIMEVSYTIQGYLLLATFIVKAIKIAYNFFKEKKSQQNQGQNQQPSFMKPSKLNKNEQKTNKQKVLCRICYDEIKSKSATKCGHVFCWECIIKTVEISQECPVCRSSCHPCEVVQLKNY